MKSSMGVELNDDEQTRIALTWDILYHVAIKTPKSPDPFEMLDFVAELIGFCHQVQRSIHDSWSDANRRLAPGPLAPQRSRAINTALKDLHTLGISPGDLVEALKTMAPTEALAHCMEKDK